MKLVTYSTDGGGPKIGYVEDGRVVPLGGSSMIEYIEHGRGAERQPGGESLALDEVRLHAPVPDPQKVIAIGLNYEDHAAETGAVRRVLGAAALTYLTGLLRQIGFFCALVLVFGAPRDVVM